MNKIWKSILNQLCYFCKDISVRFDQTSLQFCLCLIFPLDFMQEVVVLNSKQTPQRLSESGESLAQPSRTVTRWWKAWSSSLAWCVRAGTGAHGKEASFVSRWLKPLPGRRWWTSDLRTNKLWLLFTSLIFSVLAISPLIISVFVTSLLSVYRSSFSVLSVRRSKGSSFSPSDIEILLLYNSKNIPIVSFP